MTESLRQGQVSRGRQARLDNLWFSRRQLIDSDVPLTEVVAWLGGEHADGTFVENAAGDEGVWMGTVRVEQVSGRVLSVRIDEELASRAPALWYVAQGEPSAAPSAMNLVAFETPAHADGTVVSAEQFTAMPVRSADQVAAVRWYRDSGQVHQIYVAPTQRRRGIASKVLISAGLYAVASGWPRIWGDGERTDMGQALVTEGPELFRARAKPRTRVLPPMTPGVPGARRSGVSSARE